MRQPTDWMQMPSDDRILEVLDLDLMLTPAVIAENIGLSRQHVSRRLSELEKHDLVNRPKRGYYEISEKGQKYLYGTIDSDAL